MRGQTIDRVMRKTPRPVEAESPVDYYEEEAALMRFLEGGAAARRRTDESRRRKDAKEREGIAPGS